MKYKDWLKDFSKSKEYVATIGALGTDAVHDVKRYKDSKGEYWDIGTTYSNRVVVRNGTIDANNITINWKSWETVEDVTL